MRRLISLDFKKRSNKFDTHFLYTRHALTLHEYNYTFDRCGCFFLKLIQYTVAIGP